MKSSLCIKTTVFSLTLLLLPLLAFAQENIGNQEKRKNFDPVIELPDGKGKELVVTACTKCHTLEGLDAYKGYWNRTQWGAMVDSMVENGAELDEEQASSVADYLTTYFGPLAR